MKQFKIYVSLNLVGCKQETTIDFDDDAVPEDWRNDREFNEMMLGQLWESGMLDWDFEEVE